MLKFAQNGKREREDLKAAGHRGAFPAPRTPGTFGWIALLFCCLLAGRPLTIGAATLTARLDREVVPVGETVTLSLTFEGASPTGTPGLPALPGLNVTSVGQASEFTIVNGQSTSRLTFNYTLATTQPGDVTIPALQVNLGGQVVASQPLKLKIVKGAVPPSAEATLSNLAFVRLVVPKTEVYLGESFPLEIQLYVQRGQDLQMPQLKAEGFTLGQTPRPAQSQTQVGNLVYNLLVFRMSATAAKSGTVNLGPAELSLTLLIPDTSGRRRDPFEAMFGGNTQLKPVVLKSDVQPMRVLPLPTQNVPETFNGAVGSFTMTMTAGPTNLAVGDPITVKAQISGTGLLDAVRLPEQPLWRDFKTYAPAMKVDSSDPLGLTGVKSFEQVVIPQNHEVKMLPPLQFTFFDPNQKTYRTLNGTAVPLTVRPSAAGAAPPTLTNGLTASIPPPGDDLLHIRPHLALAPVGGGTLLQKPWFLALQSLPVLTWISLLVLRKRHEALANNPRLRRQRLVAQRIRDGLQELRALAAAQKSDDFFATLFRLLQEQLGERLDLPASAITEAVIDEKLSRRNLSQDTLRALHSLFKTCNQARYAPQKSSQELASLIPKVESVIQELQRLK